MVRLPRFQTNCATTAQRVARLCREEGFECRTKCTRGGAFVVIADALPEDLRALVAQAKAGAPWFGQSAPIGAREWRDRFGFWLTGVWCDAQRAEEANPAAAVLNAGVYDLNDAMTYALFVEFLSEYAQRRAAWRSFNATAKPTAL